MPEYKRVKSKDTGTEWSIVASAFDPEAEDEVGDHEAVDIAGNPIPPVFADQRDAVPAGNAALAVWQDYARSLGAPEEDIDGKSRDDLRSQYGNPGQ